MVRQVDPSGFVLPPAGAPAQPTSQGSAAAGGLSNKPSRSGGGFSFQNLPGFLSDNLFGWAKNAYSAFSGAGAGTAAEGALFGSAPFEAIGAEGIAGGVGNLAGMINPMSALGAYTMAVETFMKEDPQLTFSMRGPGKMYGASPVGFDSETGQFETAAGANQYAARNVWRDSKGSASQVHQGMIRTGPGGSDDQMLNYDDLGEFNPDDIQQLEDSMMSDPEGEWDATQHWNTYDSPFGALYGRSNYMGAEQNWQDPIFQQMAVLDEQLAQGLSEDELSSVRDALYGYEFSANPWDPEDQAAGSETISNTLAQRYNVIGDALGRGELGSQMFLEGEIPGPGGNSIAGLERINIRR